VDDKSQSVELADHQSSGMTPDDADDAGDDADSNQLDHELSSSSQQPRQDAFCQTTTTTSTTTGHDQR